MMGPLLPAVCASAAVVFAAPFVGEIRAAVQQALPGHYVAVLGAVVAVAVAAAVLGALLRIRQDRAVRYAFMASAVAIGAIYATLTSTGYPEVDAVERFHFVEYGALGVLYHRVWRARADVASLALPLLAGILVGTADEFVQWVVPRRVGEMRDVVLNGVALACGVLFALGLQTPRGLTLLRNGATWRPVAAGCALTIGACAVFVHVVHLGYEVTVGEATEADAGTVFRSRYSAPDLAAAARDRASRWQAGPPVEPAFSREDQYLSEGRWHIEERNDAAAAGDGWRAWREELILERFFAPVLDAVPGARWPEEQRAAAEAQAARAAAVLQAAGGDTREYRSAAHPFPIYSLDPLALWAPVLTALAGLGWAIVRPARHAGRAREAV